MNKKYAPIFLVALLGISILLLADVKVDYSHSTNFGNFNSYSWIKVQANNQLWEERIQNDVNHALQAKGWNLVPSGGQAAVSAFGSTKEVPTLNTFYDGLGGGWFWGGMDSESTTTQENTPEGTLVVDIFNAQNKHLIWRGVATDTLSGNPEKNSKKLTKTVDDMFKNFPPKPKG